MGLGDAVSKEDVGEETFGKRSSKRGRDDDADEEAIGAFASRFKLVDSAACVRSRY
jgi:cleavage and polyadenylation specificity factor subunit 2